MPTIQSLPLHPQQLAGIRPPAARPPAPAPMAPPAGAMPMPPGLQSPNPFQGNVTPGAFAQPAPFNPLLAQFLLAQMGGPGAQGGVSSAMFPRGPLGSFGPTPDRQRPRSQRNPYASGGPR